MDKEDGWGDVVGMRMCAGDGPIDIDKVHAAASQAPKQLFQCH